VKHFRERSLRAVGLVSVVVIVVLIVGALNFSKLPLVNSTSTYEADMANASNLARGDFVTIYGVKVGQITHMALHGEVVEVAFTVHSGDALGATTTAAVQVLSPIGTEVLALTPEGPGHLRGAIPVSRTAVSTNLIGDLSELGQTISGYNIPDLERALDVTSQDLDATSRAEVTSAFDGLSRTSAILAGQQGALASILSQGAQLATVLSRRSSQLVDLVGQSNLVLKVLDERRAAIDELLVATTSLSHEISSILLTNQPQLSSFLDSLRTVSAVLAHESDNLGRALPVLAAFSRYTANSTGSGPFADAAVPTLLLPDNVFATCAKPGAYPSSNPEVGCRP
jgi:phospholipid/cholesterol/gamma-HCH transport system substrate-binding protein